ncbi:hypothetical protein Hanom_Chr12g01143441 [Helianthus anomalus]
MMKKKMKMLMKVKQRQRSWMKAAETEEISEPFHVSHPYDEPVSTTEAAFDHSLEEPTADLPPRK